MHSRERWEPEGSAAVSQATPSRARRGAQRGQGRGLARLGSLGESAWIPVWRDLRAPLSLPRAEVQL